MGRVPKFYLTEEWIEIRKVVLEKFGRRCMRCGVNPPIIHVDHVLPRRIFPDLSLCVDNLQVLCPDCNKLKLNQHGPEWDFRENKMENQAPKPEKTLWKQNHIEDHLATYLTLRRELNFNLAREIARDALAQLEFFGILDRSRLEPRS